MTSLPGLIMRIQIKPTAAPRMSRRDALSQAGRRRPVVENYFAYRDELALKARKLNAETQMGIVFHLPMPEGWSAHKRRELIGTPHLSGRGPDTDNLQKGVWDSLFRNANDAHIWSNVGLKAWAASGAIDFVAPATFACLWVRMIETGKLDSDWIT